MRYALILLAVGLAAQQPHRVFVDPFSGGETGTLMRDLLAAALHGSGPFQVTENEERADLFLRGTAQDLQYFEQFSTNEDASGRVSTSGARRDGLAASRIFLSGSGADRESFSARERKREAVAAVRIVNRDGDVIWASTQESSGTKFRNAIADVADKVARAVAADWPRIAAATVMKKKRRSRPGSR
jgi:hypothetical protein